MGAAPLILLFLYHSYILITVYTYWRIYNNTYIRMKNNISVWLTFGVYFTLTFIYLFISVSGFDLTFHPLVVIFDFYSAKVSQAGNTANTGMLPIGGKLFMTLRNQRLRFPENFAGQFFALGSLNAHDFTLHIKGSRWRLHRNDKKKFGSKKRKNYKKVENRDAQNKILTS